MNVTELTKLIGESVQIYLNGLWVYVTIKDVKQSYGRLRYLVCPLSGNGSVWVENYKEIK